ncbi:MAG: tetratricopeptide repeat protein [Myxococcota bacterium]
MHRAFLVLAILSALLALAAAPPSLPPTAQVMKELQRLEAAGYHGSLDKERIRFSEEARQRPQDPMPRVYLAWLSLPSDASWNELKAIATIFPDNPWVHYGMGRIYATWKMRDLAEKELALTLKADPRFFPSLVVLGDLARLKEDWEGAEKHYRAALAIAADDPFARAGLGLTLLGQGKKDEARAELKLATAKYPEQPAALTTLVKLSMEAKDPEVLKAAEALAELRPKDREARKLLADLRFDSGDKAGAAKEYERLLRLGNMEIPVLQRTAGLYRELGDAEGEERTLQNLVSIDDKDVDSCLRLADLKEAKKDHEGAVGHLLEALGRDPKRAEAHMKLGQVKLAMGLPWEALESFRAALGLDAANAAAKGEVERLEAEFKLPKRRPKGNVNNVYWSVSSSLDKTYKERVALKGPASGKLRVRVRIDASGVAEGVDVLEDTLKDPVLLGHVYFGLKDATYEKRKGEPIFEFELGARPKK